MRKPCCFFTVCLLFQREIQTLACGHVVLKFLSRQHNLLRPTTMTILKGVPSILPPDLLFALARMVGLAWVGVGWRRLVPLLRVSFLLPLPPPFASQFPLVHCVSHTVGVLLIGDRAMVMSWCWQMQTFLRRALAPAHPALSCVVTPSASLSSLLPF